MKKLKYLLFIFITTLLLLIGANSKVFATTFMNDINITVKYDQTSAREMLPIINEFRKSEDAWFWNSDNTTKTVCSGLKDLTYDYSLEVIAMQRAAEIAVSFSHSRPDGSGFYTARYNGIVSDGENIAAGSSTTKATFTQWEEANETFGGQGHRRAMLSSYYNSIGIGHVIYNGYHYWVQEFRGATLDTNKTSAINDERNVYFDAIVEEIYVTPSVENYEVTYKDETALPKLNTSIKLYDTWPTWKTCPININPVWQASQSGYISISNNKFKALKPGNITIKTNIEDIEVNIPVKINPLSIKDGKVTLKTTRYEYDGTAKKPAFTLNVKGENLDTKYFTYTYKNNIKVGKASVVITGVSPYTGTITKEFEIYCTHPKTEISNDKTYIYKKCTVCGNIVGKAYMPRKVSGLNVCERTTTTMTLKWNKNSESVTGYRVYKYNSTKKQYEYIGRTTGTKYEVKDLTPGVAYQYKVRAYKTAYNKDYYGDFSDATRMTTKPKVTVLGTPTTKNSSVTLKWNKVINSTGYEIYMSTSANGTYKKIATIKNNTTITYTKTGLKKNTKYYFKVKVYKTLDGKNAYSDFSNTRVITVK